MVSPRVAVVILNWNGRKFLEQFLPSVLASTYPNMELIVADNGSTDDSLEFMRERYPGVRLIILPRNYGFARGYNEALKQVEAPYYILLNSDVEVQPGWVEPMVDLLESDPSIAACQPKLLAYQQMDHFEYAGAAGGWIDHYGYPFSRGRVFEFCERDTGQYDDPAPVFWASGAALFIRSEWFHRHRGFDDYFFAHMEEIDLCWRLQLGGGRIFSCPQSVVYHLGGGSLPRGNSRKTFLNFRNNHIMLWKNLPFYRRIWVWPLRWVLDVLTGFRSLFTGDAGSFGAIIRAQLAFLGWLLTGPRPIRIKKAGPVKLEGYLRKSLVWLHFIRRKKTFREIVSDWH